jgi:signal transduction histidine kinase
MAEFYLLPRAVSYLITAAFALCVLSQTLTVILCYYRYPRSSARITETLLESFVLGHVLVCSLLHGQTMQSYGLGIYVSGGYAGLRILFFILIAASAALTAAFSRKPQSLFAVLAASLTLPLTEELLGNAYAYLYISALAFWLIRSICANVIIYNESKSKLSALSVKNAVDSIHTGVMFCERDGFILLTNKKMQWLMTAITGGPQRNGRYFLGLLSLNEVEPGCEVTWFEEKNVCLLTDGSVWLFDISELSIHKKTYIQLTAADITERWKLTAELRPHNEELERRRKELNEAIASLHTVSRERETQRAKIRTHDLLGERLTVLLRTVRSEREPDYALLRKMSRELTYELKTVGSAPSPKDDLDILKQTFASIGVDITINGELPEDTDTAILFADISKEAVTNAVRHGLAAQVFIDMDAQDNNHILRITDNGQTAIETVREGGGIGGMREKMKPFGGKLEINTAERFIITATVPGKRADIHE